MINDPRMSAGWLRAFLVEKEVRKPGAKWDLTDSVLLVLAVDIFVRAEHHRNPPPSHLAVEAYADATETRSLVEEVLESLEKLRAASTLALVEVQAEQAALLARRTALVDVHAERVTLLAGWYERHDFFATQIDRCNERISRFAVAIAALAGAAPYLKSSLRWPPKTTWRHHAVSLAQLFVDRIRKNNPDHRIGISEKGPVVSFVRAVIPLITEETPTRGDVYVFLHEHRAEILAVDSSPGS